MSQYALNDSFSKTDKFVFELFQKTKNKLNLSINDNYHILAEFVITNKCMCFLNQRK